MISSVALMKNTEESEAEFLTKEAVEVQTRKAKENN